MPKSSENKCPHNVSMCISDSSILNSQKVEIIRCLSTDHMMNEIWYIQIRALFAVKRKEIPSYYNMDEPWEH